MNPINPNYLDFIPLSFRYFKKLYATRMLLFHINITTRSLPARRLHGKPHSSLLTSHVHAPLINYSNPGTVRMQGLTKPREASKPLPDSSVGIMMNGDIALLTLLRLNQRGRGTTRKQQQATTFSFSKRKPRLTPSLIKR